MDEQTKKDKIKAFETLSGIAHAMGTPARMRIIQILSNAPSSVEDLSLKIGESVANTSQHLQKLKKAGIVQDLRQGVVKIYSLVSSDLIDVYLDFQKMAAKLNPQLKDLENNFCPVELRSELPLDKILDQVKKKKAILLDVRDLNEFVVDAAPMSIFFPREDIKNNLKLLSKHKSIYVYCRGRYCSIANDVVKDLKKRGYKAFRLQEMSHEIKKAASE